MDLASGPTERSMGKDSKWADEGEQRELMLRLNREEEARLVNQSGLKKM